LVAAIHLRLRIHKLTVSFECVKEEVKAGFKEVKVDDVRYLKENL